MKSKFSLVAIILFISISVSCNESKSDSSNIEPEISTFFFIRHAEKDRSDKTNRNPELTEAGHDRAQKWNEIFNNITFEHVYSTDYNRTKQTAQPTAKRNNVEISIYDPRNLDGDAFIESNKGKTVLVVGHSNTTPSFVNAVINEKKYSDIDDLNNGKLFVVSIINGITKSTVLQLD